MTTPEAQREREAQYRTLLETSTDGFFINVEGRFHYVNPALVRLLGAESKEQLLGARVFDHIAPTSRTTVRARIDALRASAEPVPPLEEKYLRVDGTEVDVEVTAVAIIEGGRHAMLVTVRDISERKAAERARRRLQAQLRQSQKLEALGTLAGGIAHDFNNILTVVMANTQIALARVGPDTPVRRQLLEILHAADRAQGVTHQVLTFSRGQLAPMEVIDLRKSVAEDLPLMRSAAPADTTIDARLPPEPILVRADRSQMHQVLLNLCTNAWQSFAGGRGHITVELEVASGAHSTTTGAPTMDEAVLTVTDDGPGMGDEVRERIFDPFFTTKRPREGTGLGLSVVHGVVERHGGTIRCESELGRGSRFVVRLPRAEDEGRTTPASITRPVVGGGQRLLVLDDEPAIAEVFGELLSDQGYEVHAVTAPEDALALLRAAPSAFDLLLTDLKMPRQSGLEVVAHARAIAPALPAILISGFLGEEVDELARDLGIEAVLHKPVPAAALFRAVARVLGGETTDDTGQTTSSSG